MRNTPEPNNYEESCGPHLISIKTSDLGSSGKKVPKIIVKCKHIIMKVELKMYRQKGGFQLMHPRGPPRGPPEGPKPGP